MALPPSNVDIREVNKPTDTVAGQMEGLLSNGSDYIKRAKQSGMNAANSRGLLNSSIAAGAAQGAAYDAALPIAQQDAQTYSDTRFQNQNASNEMLLQNDTQDWQSGENVADRELKKWEVNSDQAWRTGENAADRDLSKWQVGTEQEGAMDRLKYSEDATTLRTQLDNANALERAQLAETGQTERTSMTNTANIRMEEMQQSGATSREIMSNDSALMLQITSDKGAMERQVQSDASATSRLIQQGNIDTALTSMRENANTLRTQLGIASTEAISQADNEAQLIINSDKLAQADRTYFAQTYSELNTTNLDYIYSIKVDPDLSATEKTRLINEADADFLSDTQLMGTLFGIPIEIG